MELPPLASTNPIDSAVFWAPLVHRLSMCQSQTMLLRSLSNRYSIYVPISRISATVPSNVIFVPAHLGTQKAKTDDAKLSKCRRNTSPNCFNAHCPEISSRPELRPSTRLSKTNENLRIGCKISTLKSAPNKAQRHAQAVHRLALP